MLRSDAHLRSHRLRKAVYRAEIAWGGLKASAKPTQRLVFAITNGRSGSERLTYLFSGLAQVDATHEPDPRFDTFMHDVARNPPLARKFLERVKLPAIARRSKPIYVETSHMFGKGYFEAMLETGLPFSLIDLRRDLRKTALSMLRLGTVPGRTELGTRFYMLPDEAKFVRLRNHDWASDYQLCFWHVLETAARQRAYGEMARAAGLTVVRLETEKLHEPGVFAEALTALGIAPSAEELEILEAARDVRRNAREHQIADPSGIPANLDAEEAELLRRVETSAT